ncbi:alpha 1,2-mannosyltransferase, glycosyltransferase family 71 protein [Rhodotorula toruloides]|uniref:Alpha 1,2-mannosyltransferase, glycosyltransferase family 71 protein n=1 Tax=Rhodotorula toruloides TaxID=5286 RepID=A0A511KKR0_RHOTO|nr:alpha 1,2-mannosyltransferase, glycosyltransferase family 71 protein [Rhodotorula toruloides]
MFIYASMNTSRVMGLRDEMVRYLREREGEGGMSTSEWGQGKGLVFTAGNADTFTRVLTTLKLLNSSHLASPMPAEIFSFPREEPDAVTRGELERLGATLRVVEDAWRGEGRRKNYHIKASAIIRSSFREVLYLDSDNIPAGSLLPLELWEGRNGTEEEEATRPAGLWEAKAYKRLGAMFWPDYWRTHPINPIWAIIGVPCRDEWEMEAGTILIDKSKHLDALLLAEWMMSSERFEYWFNFSDGDKDIFRFAFLALRKRWGVPGRYVSVGALPRDTISGFCGHSMLQNDHLGKPLFVHANLLKQISSGVGKGFAWGRHRQLRTPPSSLSLQGRPLTPSHKLELEEPLTDDDVDCDMVADVGYDGFPVRGRERVKGHPQEARIRRRAVWEKGIRAGFKRGGMFALCIDIRFDDPRSHEETWGAKLSVASSSPNPSRLPLEALAANVDVSYTAAPDGFELKFWQDEVLEVVHWKDVPRLNGFEEAFFEVGGKVNGEGF